MSDLISREVAIDALDCINGVEEVLRSLPSAQPYTEDEIQKIQDLEQAQFDAMYELGKQSAQPEAIRPKYVAEDRYIKNSFQLFPHCPKCNYELETGDCYCRVCGCHIDWSEDDE